MPHARASTSPPPRPKVGFLLVSTAAWGVGVLGSRFTLTRFLFFFLNDVVGYWLLGGLALSGACASFANSRLLEHSVHRYASKEHRAPT